MNWQRVCPSPTLQKLNQKRALVTTPHYLRVTRLEIGRHISNYDCAVNGSSLPLPIRSLDRQMPKAPNCAEPKRVPVRWWEWSIHLVAIGREMSPSGFGRLDANTYWINCKCRLNPRRAFLHFNWILKVEWKLEKGSSWDYTLGTSTWYLPSRSLI